MIAVLDKIDKVEVTFHLDAGTVDIVIPTVTISQEDNPSAHWDGPIKLRMGINEWLDFGSIWLKGLRNYITVERMMGKKND